MKSGIGDFSYRWPGLVPKRPNTLSYLLELCIIKEKLVQVMWNILILKIAVGSVEENINPFSLRLNLPVILGSVQSPYLNQHLLSPCIFPSENTFQKLWKDSCMGSIHSLSWVLWSLWTLIFVLLDCNVFKAWIFI